MAEDTNTDAGIGGIAEADVSQLAAIVGQASDEQLGEWMADPDGRKRILDEIFRRMAEHVDPRAIKDLDAVIHFEITDAPSGGSDTYEAVFKGGTVTVNDEPTVADPRVAIVAGPVPFLKLVAGQESGPAMFMTGKLRIKGDMMFASQMTSFFRIPTSK